MSDQTITAEQAQIQILSEEHAAQVAELTRRVSALRVEVLQHQQALNAAHTEISQLETALGAAQQRVLEAEGRDEPVVEAIASEE